MTVQIFFVVGFGDDLKFDFEKKGLKQRGFEFRRD